MVSLRSLAKMKSIRRSTFLFFSFFRSASTLVSFSKSAVSQRRAFLATTSSLVTVTSIGLSSLARATPSSTTYCEVPSLTRRTMSSIDTGYLNAADAAALDVELMSTPGYSLEQLMELAGLSVAEAIYQVVKPQDCSMKGGSSVPKPRILLICGPGNNGGDGLVAARHLVFFGFDCVVVYPKRSTKEHFVNLVHQCEDVNVEVVDEMPFNMVEYDAIVDAIFGFSFKGAPREPFATALRQMMTAQKAGVPVISVDVPSGWNVDEGDVAGTGFTPEVLISLTTPKQSARGFKGRHFVGGRFLPPKLAEKYQVQMPPYPGVSQVYEMAKDSAGKSLVKTRDDVSQQDNDTGWEAEYVAYLEQKYARTENDEKMPTDDTNFSSMPKNEQSDSNEATWELQYADYCAKKEAHLAEKDKKEIEEQKRQQA